MLHYTYIAFIFITEYGIEHKYVKKSYFLQGKQYSQLLYHKIYIGPCHRLACELSQRLEY
jgi:hypothetical protein